MSNAWLDFSPLIQGQIAGDNARLREEQLAQRQLEWDTQNARIDKAEQDKSLAAGYNTMVGDYNDMLTNAKINVDLNPNLTEEQKVQARAGILNSMREMYSNPKGMMTDFAMQQGVDVKDVASARSTMSPIAGYTPRDATLAANINGSLLNFSNTAPSAPTGPTAPLQNIAALAEGKRQSTAQPSGTMRPTMTTEPLVDLGAEYQANQAEQAVPIDLAAEQRDNQLQARLAEEEQAQAQARAEANGLSDKLAAEELQAPVHQEQVIQNMVAGINGSREAANKLADDVLGSGDKNAIELGMQAIAAAGFVDVVRDKFANTVANNDEAINVSQTTYDAYKQAGYSDYEARMKANEVLAAAEGLDNGKKAGRFNDVPGTYVGGVRTDTYKKLTLDDVDFKQIGADLAEAAVDGSIIIPGLGVVTGTALRGFKAIVGQALKRGLTQKKAIEKAVEVTAKRRPASTGVKKDMLDPFRANRSIGANKEIPRIKQADVKVHTDPTEPAKAPMSKTKKLAWGAAAAAGISTVAGVAARVNADNNAIKREAAINNNKPAATTPAVTPVTVDKDKGLVEAKTGKPAPEFSRKTQEAVVQQAKHDVDSMAAGIDDGGYKFTVPDANKRRNSTQQMANRAMTLGLMRATGLYSNITTEDIEAFVRKGKPIGAVAAEKAEFDRQTAEMDRRIKRETLNVRYKELAAKHTKNAIALQGNQLKQQSNQLKFQSNKLKYQEQVYTSMDKDNARVKKMFDPIIELSKANGDDDQAYLWTVSANHLGERLDKMSKTQPLVGDMYISTMQKLSRYADSDMHTQEGVIALGEMALKLMKDANRGELGERRSTIEQVTLQDSALEDFVQRFESHLADNASDDRASAINAAYKYAMENRNKDFNWFQR